MKQLNSDPIHYVGTYRPCGLDCSEPILTDPSFANACDINVIMANYAKTGMLGHVNNSEARYIDNTEIPDLARAFDIVTKAEQMFYDLPAQVRKLMDNDPSQLESFILDPQNTDILIKNGIITPNAAAEPSKEFKPAASSSDTIKKEVI